MKVFRIEIGGVAEWLKAADCKSARVSVRRFESYPHHHTLNLKILKDNFVLLCNIERYYFWRGGRVVKGSRL